MSTDVLVAYGMANADAVVAAAEKTGVPLWIVAAMVEKESNGHNVYGNDRGGVYAVGDPERPDPNVVTEENFARFAQRVLGGETSNGVGPAQITWPGFLKDAEARGVRLWVPRENIWYGARLLRDYLPNWSDDAIREAGRRYNGSGLYGTALLERAKVWKDRLGEGTVAGRTGLGWSILDTPGTATRPGPHTPTPGNGREIRFRNSATADLLIAMVWLVHTGVEGRFPDEPVYLLHGARDRGATFGTDNSDHKAEVAEDMNWPEHPWEPVVGTAAYDRHMKDPKQANAHAVFRAAQARLTPPNSRTLVRWCGETWFAPNGMGYPRGHRDCMHFVIEAPDWDRINAARDWLHTWFVPPRTTQDVRDWQDRVGAVVDGQWGPGSVRAMRAKQKQWGVPQTGLPGDLATWRAFKALTAWPKGHVAFWQKSLNTLGYRGANGKTLAVDDLPGANTTHAVERFQKDNPPLAVDGSPGDASTKVLRQRLAEHAQPPVVVPDPVPDPEPEPEPDPNRLGGVDHFHTAGMVARQAPAQSKVYLATEGADAAAAAGAGDGLVLFARRGSDELPGHTYAALRRIRPDELVVVGGTAAIPDRQARAARLAAENEGDDDEDRTVPGA